MPLDESYVPKKSSYPPIPEGIYQVQILKMELVKDVKNFKDNGKHDEIKFSFVVVDPKKFIRRRLWKSCAIKLSPAFESGQESTLYSIFSAVKKVKLTKAEAASVSIKDLNTLEGAQLRLSVKVKAYPDGTEGNKITDYISAELVIPFDPNAKPEAKPANEFEQDLADTGEQLAKEAEVVKAAMDPDEIDPENPLNEM